MSIEKLEIENYYDLLGLHKALLEAKFHKNPENIEVCFSPIIAKISNEIVEILMKKDAEKDASKKDSWEKWRRLENKSYFRECALSNAASFHYWKDMNYEQKLVTCRNLLSPFVATSSEMELFIQEVDDSINKRK